MDLVEGADLDGWEIRTASGINSTGMIVGALAKPGFSFDKEACPYVVHRSETGAWRLTVLPDHVHPDAAPLTSIVASISDQLDVLVFGYIRDQNGSILGTNAFIMNLANAETADQIVPQALPLDVLPYSRLALSVSSAVQPAKIVGTS